MPEFICPHCGADVRKEGIYLKEIRHVLYYPTNSGRGYYFEDGDRSYHIGVSGYICAACDGNITRNIAEKPNAFEIVWVENG